MHLLGTSSFGNPALASLERLLGAGGQRKQFYSPKFGVAMTLKLVPNVRANCSLGRCDKFWVTGIRVWIRARNAALRGRVSVEFFEHRDASCNEVINVSPVTWHSALRRLTTAHSLGDMTSLEVFAIAAHEANHSLRCVSGFCG